MKLISYRGPGVAGGLSAGLTDGWDQYASAEQEWWHVSDRSVAVATDVVSKPRQVATFERELVDDHYRYCHELIWPVMHDLPQYAVYRADDCMQYRRFNVLFGRYIARAAAQGKDGGYFVHDYQLALLPKTLRSHLDTRLAVFWHIPWPKRINLEFVPAIREIAYGLLQCDYVGFHAHEYAENFMRFVNEHFQDYSCDGKKLLLIANANPIHKDCREKGETPCSEKSTLLLNRGRGECRLVVAPLGIDFDRWARLASMGQRIERYSHQVDQPMVLSVDRTDYTKGIYGRLKAIDQFFVDYPQWLGKVSFLQFCGRTRAGVSSFDAYWDKCRCLAENIKERWSADTWQPLIWEEKSVSALELSQLYREAALMLVTPIRDGLNLTAKEYVACQGPSPGVLALSSGAGAWHELGGGAYSLMVDPERPKQMSSVIHLALIMSQHEKILRMELLKHHVKRNSLKDWWQQFTELIATDKRESVAAVS